MLILLVAMGMMSEEENAKLEKNHREAAEKERGINMLHQYMQFIFTQIRSKL